MNSPEAIDEHGDDTMNNHAGVTCSRLGMSHNALQSILSTKRKNNHAYRPTKGEVPPCKWTDKKAVAWQSKRTLQARREARDNNPEVHKYTL